MANPNAIPALEANAVRNAAIVVRKRRAERIAQTILGYIPNHHQWAVVPLPMSMFLQMNLDTLLSFGSSSRGLSGTLATIVAEVASEAELRAIQKKIADSKYEGSSVFLALTRNKAAFSTRTARQVRFYTKIDYRTISRLIARQ